MPKRKTAEIERIAEEAVEAALGGDVRPSSDKILTAAVNRLISGLDIELNDLQKGADELLALSIDKLKDTIINTVDDEIRIKAINTSISLSNNVIKRRLLALEEGGSITVNIAPGHVPGGKGLPDAAQD